MGWYDPTGRLTDPSAEEFATWVSAQEAFAHLIGGVTPAFSANLVNRLKNDILYGAASIAKFVEDGVQKTLYRVSIDKTWWGNVEGGDLRVYDALWAHGDITLIVPNGVDGGGTQVHFFAVKFEPQHLRDATPAAFKLSPPAPFVLAAPRLPTRSIAIAPAAPAPRANDGNGEDITQEEYDGWYEPGEVLDALPKSWPSQTKISTVADLMRDGLIRAVAGEMGGWDKPVERFELPKEIWKSWASHGDHDFWTAGKRSIFKDNRDYNGRPFRAYRVRLDPEDIHKRLPIAPGTIRAPAPQSRWIEGETFVTEPLRDVQTKVSLSRRNSTVSAADCAPCVPQAHHGRLRPHRERGKSL